MLQNNNKNFYYLILIAMGLSGAAALIYEVISSKFLSYFFGSDTYSVSTMLSAFLLGIALGSLLMSRFINRVKNKRKLFTILQFLIGAYALVFITNLSRFPVLLTFFYSFSGSSLFLITLSKFLAGLLYLIFPTVLLGACFPLAGSLLIKKNKEVGVGLGTLYSLDTFGAILGASIAGFVLIPTLGLRLTSLVAALLSFLSGFLILEKKLKNLIVFVFICSIFLFFFFLFPSDISPTAYIIQSHFKNDFISEENSVSEEVILNQAIIFEKDTPYGVVSVTEPEGRKGRLLLKINGRGQCSSDTISERVISHLALANFEEPINVLNIGLGCGTTLEAILYHNNVKEVDVVEINPVIVEVANRYFSEDNHYALEDKRTNIIIDDAFHFLLMTDKKYDAVIIDVESPGVPHSSPLYTVEYFQIIAERLSKKGVFGLWAYFDDYSYLRDAYYSMKEAFPYVYLTIELESPIFIASKTKINIVNFEKNLLHNYPIIENFIVENFTGFEKELIQKIENDTGYSLSTLDNPVLEYFDAQRIQEHDLEWKSQHEQ